MYHRILAVTENGCVELLKKGALIILGVVFLLGFLLPLYISSKMSFASAGAAQAPLQLQKVILALDQFVMFIGLVAAMLFAAGSVESEVSKRTLCSVMIRPLSRWEYLAGRALSVELFFLLFALSAVVCSYAASACMGCSLPGVFLLGVIQRVCRDVMWILIALSLGSMTSSVITMTFITLVVIFASLAPHIPSEIHWAVPIFQKLLHYVTPGISATDFFSRESPADPSATLEACILLENLMYGVMVFLGCSWVFTKRDLRLRD